MGNTWNIGIFKEQNEFLQTEGNKPANLISTFLGRNLRTGFQHIHTYADPFLFEEKGDLYLIAEIQAVGDPGYINCWKYTDYEKWENIGPVLKTVSHHSYPFIFRDRNEVYILPESSETGEVSLWKFENFPKGLKKVKTILKGAYVDSNIIFHNNRYYLFTTNSTDELLIFSSDELLSDTWISHPSNPVSNNKQISRNGGGIMVYGNKLVRIAQNGTNGYGGGIIFLDILTLNEFQYEEIISIDDFKPLQNYSWQRLGRHHLSVCNFRGNVFIAMDGYAKDITINKFINGFFKFFKK